MDHRSLLTKLNLDDGVNSRSSTTMIHEPVNVYGGKFDEAHRQNQIIIDGPKNRLCSLPDDVLHSILGLLPVKEAVRTCIISQRWQRLWMSMPVLRFVFADEYWGDIANFIKFVDKVCSLHEPNYPIQKFILSCSVLRDGPLINAWITNAVKSGRVQVLSLDLSSFAKEDPFVMPQCIFSSETLMELRLNLFLRTLELPPSTTSLPILKTLGLVGVSGIVNEETIKKLLSSSPLLETLSLNDCVWNDNGASEEISSPSLRVLEVLARDVDYTLPPLRIKCPNLEKLSYSGNLGNKVRMNGPTTKLHAAEISLHGVEKNMDNVFKLLHTLDGVKRLTFFGDSAMDSNSSEGQYLDRVPLFDNLVELVLSVGRMEMTMLRRCPCIERIVLRLGGAPSGPRTLELLEPVPLCFETHLKKITLPDFYGNDRNIESVGILLQSGAVLEEMVLEISGWQDAKQVLEKVRNLPKASKACRVYVVTQNK